MSNEFEMHEALDRTSNVLDIVQRQLVEHSVFKKTKKYKKSIKKVAKQLAKLYQQLGADSLIDQSYVPEASNHLYATDFDKRLSKFGAYVAKTYGVSPQNIIMAARTDPNELSGLGTLHRVIIYSAPSSLPEFLQGTVVTKLSDTMYLCSVNDDQYTQCLADISIEVADFNLQGK